MSFNDALALLREVHHMEVQSAIQRLREENVSLRSQLSHGHSHSHSHSQAASHAGSQRPSHHGTAWQQAEKERPERDPGAANSDAKQVRYDDNVQEASLEDCRDSKVSHTQRLLRGLSGMSQGLVRQLTAKTSRTDTEWLSHSHSDIRSEEEDDEDDDEDDDEGRATAMPSMATSIAHDEHCPDHRDVDSMRSESVSPGPRPSVSVPSVGLPPAPGNFKLAAPGLPNRDDLEESWTMGMSGHASDMRPSNTESGTHTEEVNNRTSIGSESAAPGGAAFPLRKIWRMERVGSTVSQGNALANELRIDEEDYDTERREARRGAGFFDRLVSHPNSLPRFVWDLLGGLLICYDCIVIPLRVFDPPETIFLILMDWVTLIFWTINMGASCLVGYVDHGKYIMKPSLIVIRYLKSWFVIDIIVVAQDWIFIVVAATSASDADNTSDSVRLLRTLRIIRTLRLVRLAKLRRILVLINEYIDSEHLSILANIVKMIVMLLAINHVIACAWFGVAKTRCCQRATWVRGFGFEESRWEYQYMTSFHWSITQFTPASMDVGPTNLAERVFAVSVVVFALVGFSYLVGSITGSLTQLRSMQEDTAKQFWNLRRFLKQNKVPPKLSLRVQKHLEHAYSQKKEHLPMKSILLFQLLSEQLRAELLAAISVPPMLSHPLFKHFHDTSKVTLHRLANSAISRKQLAIGDKLFYPGEKAREMYFPAVGRLQYWKETENYKHSEIVDTDEDWIAEPVLWTAAWYHLGVLVALIPSDMLIVSAKEFAAVIKQNPQALIIARRYARRFMNWFIEHEPMSDIIQGDEESDVIRTFLNLDANPSLLQVKSGSGYQADNRKSLRKRMSFMSQGLAAKPAAQ